MTIDLKATGAIPAGVRLSLGLPVSAKLYGAVGDGVTDDTTALQAWLDTATDVAPKNLYLPAGTYKLTAALSIPFAPSTRIVGAGRGLSILQQTTAGQPVIKFLSDLTHSITLSDLELGYSSAQTNADSIAIFYDGPPTSFGFFHHHYSNLTIRNAYKGIAVDDNSGEEAVWNLWCENLHFYDIKHNAVFMLPSSLAGIPQVAFRGVEVSNTGGSVTSTGSAFEFGSVEVTIENLDIEGWHNHILSMLGGPPCIIRGLHVEHHKWSTAFARCFYGAGGSLRVEQFDISGATTAGCTDMAIIAQPDTDCDLTLKDGRHNVDCTLGTSYIRDVVYTSSTGSITAVNITKVGGDLNQPGEGNADPRPFLVGAGRLPNGRLGVQLGAAVLTYGTGSPEGVVTARVGSVFARTDGAAGTTLYVKESGTSNTGWRAIGFATELFIPASNMQEFSVGSPDRSSVGGLAPAWFLDPSATEGVGTSVMKSEFGTWATFDVVARIVNPTADAGDVRLSLNYATNRGVGDTVNTATTVSVTATAAAQDIMQEVTVASGLAVPANADEHWQFRFDRAGADGADTKAGHLALMGIVLRKAS